MFLISVLDTLKHVKIHPTSTGNSVALQCHASFRFQSFCCKLQEKTWGRKKDKKIEYWTFIRFSEILG